MSADVIEWLDEAGSRLLDRMDGLSEDEWRWLPTDNPEIGIRWRLDHIVSTLTEDRNAEWLRLTPPPLDPPAVRDAASAVAATRLAIGWWRALLVLAGDTLSGELGSVAGPYATSTRLAFVLHVLDELAHHAAEVALLRDLYAAR